MLCCTSLKGKKKAGTCSLTWKCVMLWPLWGIASISQFFFIVKTVANRNVFLYICVIHVLVSHVTVPCPLYVYEGQEGQELKASAMYHSIWMLSWCVLCMNHVTLYGSVWGVYLMSSQVLWLWLRGVYAAVVWFCWVWLLALLLYKFIFRDMDTDVGAKES